MISEHPWSAPVSQKPCHTPHHSLHLWAEREFGNLPFLTEVLCSQLSPVSFLEELVSVLVLYLSEVQVQGSEGQDSLTDQIPGLCTKSQQALFSSLGAQVLMLKCQRFLAHPRMLSWCNAPTV